MRGFLRTAPQRAAATIRPCKQTTPPEVTIMSKIRTLYAVHHSHTDIGYTDLQERVTAQQVDYIRTAVTMTQARPAFRWNCETLYCVEQFFAEAAPAEQQAFLALAREGKIGLSANYLNFTDLVDCEVLGTAPGRLAGYLCRGRHPAAHGYVRRYQRPFHGPAGCAAGCRGRLSVHQRPLPPRHVPALPEPERILLAGCGRQEAAGLER